MIGEQFFKDSDSSEEEDDLKSYDEDLESLPYQVVKRGKVKTVISHAIYLSKNSYSLEL